MFDIQLRNAYLHITNACEFHCPFCYASDIHIKGNKCFFDTNKILSIIDIIGKTTIKNLSLVGGNPVLHPDIAKIIKHVKNTTDLNLILMTNTGDFTHNSLNDCYSFVDVLMVTLHSDCESEHDRITNRDGAYRELIGFLLDYQFFNPSGKIKIAMNITPYAYDKLYSAIKKLIEKGINVDEVELQRIAPVSQDRMNEEFLVNAKQANIALSQAKKIRDELKVKVCLVDPFPLCFVDDDNREIVVPCKCGKTDININGEGDVSRCGADPNYQLGNIFECSIEEIWNSSELTSFRNREYLPQECVNCDSKTVCGGGCPMSVMAYKAKNKSHLDMFRKSND